MIFFFFYANNFYIAASNIETYPTAKFRPDSSPVVLDESKIVLIAGFIII